MLSVSPWSHQEIRRTPAGLPWLSWQVFAISIKFVSATDVTGGNRYTSIWVKLEMLMRFSWNEKGSLDDGVLGLKWNWREKRSLGSRGMSQVLKRTLYGGIYEHPCLGVPGSSGVWSLLNISSWSGVVESQKMHRHEREKLNFLFLSIFWQCSSDAADFETLGLLRRGGGVETDLEDLWDAQNSYPLKNCWRRQMKILSDRYAQKN